MTRRHSRLAALASVAIAGCAEGKLPTALPPDLAVDAAISAPTALPDLVLAVDDAATRVADALADAEVATTLRSELTTLAEAMRSGDLMAAQAAMRDAVTTFEAYEAIADRPDAPERAVLEVVLELVDGALRVKPSRR